MSDLPGRVDAVTNDPARIEQRKSIEPGLTVPRSMNEPTPEQQQVADTIVRMNRSFAEAADRAAAAYLPAAQAFNQGLVNLAEALRRAKLR